MKTRVRPSPPAGASAVRHRRASPWPEFLFGVAYYPEHWTGTERRRDIKRMRRAGINVVRMGEFAWDHWEPRAGQFDFALFDETIEALGRSGIRTVLGTPTAAPPRWLTRDHPEILRRTADGRVCGHGGRQHANTHHPAFREAAHRVTTALARHYAANPWVIGWQIDNELHCIGTTDFSLDTERAFQGWLRRRHRTIAALNRHWGTAFNAGTYEAFEDVPLPLNDRPDNYPPHPGQLLDFHRFTSDATCEFHREQVAILRAANRHWFVFHNGLFRHLDYWQLAGDLDWLGLDLYPGFGGDGDSARSWSALKLETCRAHSGSFIVPELASGAGGARPGYLETPEPGQMRLWAWQAVAHGADGVFHFRWRTCRAGQEIYWHGVLDHDDVPRRRLRELAAEADELRRLAPHLLGTVADVRLAVLTDFEADESHEAVTELLPAPRHQAGHLLAALLARHLPAGLVHARDSLAGLDAVFVPSFAVIPPDLARRLTAFVRAGGTLICTAGTGRRDEHNRALAVTPPGALRRLLGATVVEQGAFRTPLLDVRWADGSSTPGSVGYEMLRPDTAGTCARWALGADAPKDRIPHPAVGKPAVTLNRVGRGRAVLAGLWLDAAGAAALVAWLAAELSWKPAIEAAEAVTFRRRLKRGCRLAFLLNHSPQPKPVVGVPAGRDLITGRSVTTGRLVLEPFGVRVIRER